jgi:amidase
VLGWPGVNVPAGFVGDGLPVGAQLLGPADSEPLLLSLAAQLEADQRWHELWPPAGGRGLTRGVNGSARTR